jgi:hypothetical protein
MTDDRNPLELISEEKQDFWDVKTGKVQCSVYGYCRSDSIGVKHNEICGS